MSVATSLTDVLPSEALSIEGVADAWPRLGAAPEAVVHPESTEEVATAVRWAGQHGVGVVPLGSGRRFSGARSDRPFIVLSTDRLSGIEIYEPGDLTLTARAGTALAELGERLGAHGQWLPFDPPEAVDRTLGGLVATGESGPVWMGYGELRNHVLGMTVVTGDARTLRLGGRVVKNVAGFDLLKPIVGSRGRLGVITSVCVRTFPRPATDRVLVLRGDNAEELCGTAQAVGTAPVMPVSSILIAPARALGAGAALVVRLHGADTTVAADQRTLERHAGVSFERPDEGLGVLAAARDHAADGDPTLLVSVLPSRLAEGLAAVERLLGGVEIAADTYGGRVRVAAGDADAESVRGLRVAIEALGGTLVVRSTPGAARATDVGSAPSRAEAALIDRLERVFDPGGVLWPPRS